MFQNTPTKMDMGVSNEEEHTNDASTLTVEMTTVDSCVSTNKPPRTFDSATSTRDLTVVCAANTQRDQVCYDYQSISED
jgi:hypothetical protein